MLQVLIGLLAMCLIITFELWQSNKRLKRMLELDKQKMARLFDENIEAENKARIAANFGDDFIAQPVHGEQKPVRVNLTTLQKDQSESLPDWSLEFECQTDPSTW